MLDIRLKDGMGKKVFAEVTNDKELLVTVSTSPPLKSQKVKPFRQYMTTTGLSSGSNDMGIDGSVTNVDFCIPADSTNDRYITSLNIEVAYGASGGAYEWADGTALTNGMRLYYTSIAGEVDIHDAIKSNQDLFRLGFRLIPTAWEIRHLGALNDYGYIIAIDLTKMGLPYGIKLDTGTNQKLIMTVRDNAGTAADTFNVIAYGFDRFA